MKIYYVMETEGRRFHVRAALGVDVRFGTGSTAAWQELEHYYGISADGELRPCNLVAGVPQNTSVCHRGCPRHPASRLGAQVAADGLHVIEDFAVEKGSIGVINAA